ncbi:MAG: NAD(P)-dependent alcohol dehydrogenase [Actinobacteria bacterium]|nr:MAG: NAD(P)-dependent alcohol dehydrogenase [Actinomycetota bacterium]
MRAIVRSAYGSPDVLELKEIDKPGAKDEEVLVRVRAASVNPADWYSVTGTPYVARPQMGLRKPKSTRTGVDFAGTVEAVGANVTQFQPGDEVFGGRDGAFAEYVCVREERAVVPKPTNLTFEQAAAVPVAALTALQGLRDKAQLQPGQKVLINGASGGVGTFAVQVAKALGAEVTGVCSTRNVDIVRSLGADHVVDYTKEDFTRSDQRYDVMFDVAGSRSWSECRRVLNPQATLVIVGAPKGNRLMGPLSHIVKVRLAAVRGSQKAVFFIAKFNKADMLALRDLLEAGKVTPVIDRSYELSEIADAFRYLGEGHAQGKIVITV